MITARILTFQRNRINCEDKRKAGLHAIQGSVSFAEGHQGGGEAFFALEKKGVGSAVWAHISGKPSPPEYEMYVFRYCFAG